MQLPNTYPLALELDLDSNDEPKDDYHLSSLIFADYLHYFARGVLQHWGLSQCIDSTPFIWHLLKESSFYKHVHVTSHLPELAISRTGVGRLELNSPISHALKIHQSLV